MIAFISSDLVTDKTALYSLLIHKVQMTQFMSTSIIQKKGREKERKKKKDGIYEHYRRRRVPSS